MDYKLLISNALENENWDDVIKFATEAKEGISLVGIKKGYLNLFKSCYSNIQEALEEAGIIVLNAYSKLEVNALIKKKELSVDLVNEKIVVIFCNRSTAVATLATKGFKLQMFTVSERNKNTYDKVTGNITKTETTMALKNMSTGESLKFRPNKDGIVDKGLFKAYMRDKNIEAILED